jgi:hypothetical protein
MMADKDGTAWRIDNVESVPYWVLAGCSIFNARQFIEFDGTGWKRRKCNTWHVELLLKIKLMLYIPGIFFLLFLYADYVTEVYKTLS